jgi:large subunit ribosomal protein L13
MKTYIPAHPQTDRRWHLIDAEGRVLGRLASRVAVLLRGKHKPTFTPHQDTGDFVVVVNAAGIKLTGRKAKQKKRYSHSGYPGGFKETSYETLIRTRPERVITEAVQGMLPRTRQGRRLIKNLKVYRGPTHRHQAQQPAPLAW